MAVFISLLALGTTLYGWGWKARKQTETLNGFGVRMEKVEKEQERSRERDTQWLLSLERVLESNRQLVASVGEARGLSIQCQVDMENATEKIRDEIKNMVASIHASDIAAETRMTRVETEVRLMREMRS